MGGVLFNLLVGRVLEHFGLSTGYQIAFALSSSFHVLAYLLILATVRRVEPVHLSDPL